MNYANVERKIQSLLRINRSIQVLQDVVDLLYDSFDQYNWFGIYLVKGNHLILGPWRGGQATEHTTIPIDKGICGSAAQTGKTERIDDVSSDARYLSCFSSTRSELVVPIKKDTKIIGEIDIDSDVPCAFTPDDEQFIERVAQLLASVIYEII